MEDNYFIILCCFLPYINMNQPKVYICSPLLEPSSHLLPHPTPLGCHRAPALGSLHHTANSHWRSILHMVTCMFLCCSLNSSHPLLPSLCPQVCSLCLRLHCCPADKFTSTILLETHICINIQYLLFSFWLISLYRIGSRFIHLVRTDSNAFLFYGWVIFHCICAPQLLYPLICWWTSRLFPCPSYGKYQAFWFYWHRWRLGAASWLHLIACTCFPVSPT